MTATGDSGRPGIAGPAGVLRLGPRAFGAEQLLVMTVVTGPPGKFWDPAAAMERVHAAAAEGADIVEIGGAADHPQISRFVAAVRASYPDLVISVQAGRPEAAREACAAGADLLRGGPGLAGVAAEFGAGLVCAHGGPGVDGALALAARAADAGVEPERVIIGAGHQAGPLADLVASGWPVLVSPSGRPRAGEAGGLPGAEGGSKASGVREASGDEGGASALAAVAVAAWLGARVFQADRVLQTRQALRMVSAIRGDIPPACAVRGLA